MTYPPPPIELPEEFTKVRVQIGDDDYWMDLLHFERLITARRSERELEEAQAGYRCTCGHKVWWHHYPKRHLIFHDYDHPQHCKVKGCCCTKFLSL